MSASSVAYGGITNFEPASERPPILFVGAGEGMGFLRALAAEYGRQNPKVSVLVPPSVGSAGGVAAVAAGRAHLARIDRQLNDAERQAGLHERALFEIPIAFYINPVSGVSAVTQRQLRHLLTGRVNNWSQLGGRDLAVKIIGREANSTVLSAVRDFLTKDRELIFGHHARTAMTDQNSLAMVEETHGAIGFGPLDTDMSIGTQVLSIDGVLPMARCYPCKITVSVAWRDFQLDDDTRGFLEFMDSDEASKMMEKFDVTPSS